MIGPPLTAMQLRSLVMSHGRSGSSPGNRHAASDKRGYGEPMSRDSAGVQWPAVRDYVDVS
jgi:hypothetical protein